MIFNFNIFFNGIVVFVSEVQSVTAVLPTEGGAVENV